MKSKVYVVLLNPIKKKYNVHNSNRIKWSAIHSSNFNLYTFWTRNQWAKVSTSPTSLENKLLTFYRPTASIHLTSSGKGKKKKNRQVAVRLKALEPMMVKRRHDVEERRVQVELQRSTNSEKYGGTRLWRDWKV